MRDKVLVFTMILFMFAAATVLIYTNIWGQQNKEYKDGTLISREVDCEDRYSIY